MPFLSLLASLVGFAAILAAAWWAVRLLSQGYSMQSKSRMIQVVERIGLGADKQLVIVKAAGRAYLLGVTAQHIEKIEELDPDDLTPAPDTGQDSAFLDVFKNALSPKKRKEGGDERAEKEREA